MELAPEMTLSLAAGISLLALVLAFPVLRWIMRQHTGTDRMRETAESIRVAAETYLGGSTGASAS